MNAYFGINGYWISKYVNYETLSLLKEENLALNMELLEKDYIIKNIPLYYNQLEIKSIGRRLGIPESDYYVESLPPANISDNLIERVAQLSKYQDLKAIINEDKDLKRPNFFMNFAKEYYKKDSLDNIKAENFGKFFTALLCKLDNLTEKDFEESELITPIEFEDKMREKANLSEDIVRAGLVLKNDIVSLRKRANALDYKEYEKLLQRIGRIYRNTICNIYPEDTVSSSKRFRALYKLINDNVPDYIKNSCEDIDMYVEGLIYDTIAHCLIFNQ